MLTKSTSSLRKAGPPAFKPQSRPEPTVALDTLAARPNGSDRSLQKTLVAMASLAATLGPQAAQAAEVAPVETVQEASLLERVESRIDSLGDRASELKDSLDPNGYLNERTGKVGDYDLSFTPVDLDLKPKWRSGPALRFKGDFLETRLSKTRQLDGGWSMTQGANAKITGEISTYDDAQLDFQTGLFRDYRGPVGENFEARFRNEIGIRHRFAGDEEGLRAGVSFRQELEGGNYQFFGHDYSLYAEGRQSAYHNLDTGRDELSYKFMVGPKKDFNLNLFGKKATLTLTVGPEVKGSNHGEAFDWGVSSKARLRLRD